MVRAGYLWDGVHRRTFTSVEVNGNQVVKRPLGFSCLKGDALAVFLQAASSPRCARLGCSRHAKANLRSSVLEKRQRGGSHSSGLGLGVGLQTGERELQENKNSWRQQLLPSCSSILLALASVHVSSVKERLRMGCPSLVVLTCVAFD